MLNYTRIPAPRVTIVDPQTGIVSNEWFRFFNNLYAIAYAATGSVTPGTYGSATAVPQITVDDFGTITGISNVPIAIDASQIVSGTIASARISGAYTGITGVGTLTVGTWNATAITTPYGGTGLTSYTAGDTLYYASGTALAKLAIGASTFINTSSGTAPQWTNPSTITIGKATNLVGGAANRIAYQTATDTTGFIVAPTVSNTYLNWSGSAYQWSSNPLGDVIGPASATDNAIARFDTTTGKLIQNSTVTISDNGDIENVNAIGFDITPTTLPTAQGTLYWDNADSIQTLSLVMEGGNAVQQIGEEQYYRIKCSAAVTEGQVIMFTGTVGASGGLTGAPATGLTASTASYVMGVATESGALNDWIYVTSFGLVRGINTTGGAEAWVDGEILYYNPAVAGGLTKTLPTAPNAKVQVCAVVHAASNGSLFIRPTFGGILGQYEGDVNFTSTAAGNLIRRNAGNTAWENVATIPNTNLANSTISGVALGSNLFDLTAGTGVSFSVGTTYNGSAAITINATGSGGTVTSVAALTLGTAGTDLSSTVANGTTTPVITLQVPTASSVNRGALSAADWTTFNSKAPGVTFTSNYIPYGQGTTTLNQSAGLQFDGTNFTTTGFATATSFRPSSSTIPTNGMYLPAANTVGIAANGTNFLNITSSKVLVGSATSPSGGSATLLVAANVGGGIQLANIAGVNGALINSVPGAGLAFYGYTGAVGSETYTERMRMTPNGGLNIGAATDPGAGNLSVTGSVSAGSRALGGVFAAAGGLTAVTAVAGSLTLATGGVTIASQVMASGSVWRVTAYGTYAASSSANARTLTMACFWGTTALTSVTTGNILAGTAQTTPWRVELEITGSSATAAWCTAILSAQVTSATIPLNYISTAASVTGLTTTSTLDFRVGQTGTATAGDTINVHSVILERIK
jgi:hypothetical protein